MKGIMGLGLVLALGASAAWAADAANGKKVYDAKCASCHGKDGKGNAGMLKMFKVEPAALNVVDESAADKGGFIAVTADGRNKMPAYKGKLKDSEIEDVAEYAASLAGGGAAPAGGAKAEEPKAEAPKIDAAAIYKAKCAMCHGPKGEGKSMPNTKFVAEDIKADSDEELAKVIKDGKGKMPKYDGKLKDDEIGALVGFIRTLGN